jgi:hypothetical protein
MQQLQQKLRPTRLFFRAFCDEKVIFQKRFVANSAAASSKVKPKASAGAEESTFSRYAGIAFFSTIVSRLL